MQFTTVIVALFAAVAAAAPTEVESTQLGSCNIVGCLGALAPTEVNCVAAVLQLGLDPLSDIPCLKKFTHTGQKLPASCKGCGLTL